jgi:hypothetical protein
MDNMCEANETRIGAGIDEASGSGGARTAEAGGPRDGEGRFRKGNKGGPGNPFARQVALLRKAALEAVSEEDIHGIMHAMKEKALAGDIAAAKLVLAYGAGKPTPTPDPDTLDQHEFKTHVNNNLRTAEGIVGIIQGLPLELVLKMVRAVLPALEESKRQMAAEVIRGPAEDEEDITDEEERAASSDVAANGETQSQGEDAGEAAAVLPGYLQEILDRDAADQAKVAGSSRPANLAELRVLAAQVNELRELLEVVVERRKTAGTPDMPQVEGGGGRLAGLMGGRNEVGGRITNGSMPHGE